jgi:hypothetical protein
MKVEELEGSQLSVERTPHLFFIVSISGRGSCEENAHQQRRWPPARMDGARKIMSDQSAP